jgi:hypothetical protein
MRLRKQEREFFRKLLENFFVKNPHFKLMPSGRSLRKGTESLGKRFIVL